jgi:ferredoxin--NADP+ reductase
MFKVIKKQDLGPEMVLTEINAPQVTKHAQPGQFIILRVNEKGERIPLTIADSDSEKGRITVVFQKIGKTTNLLGSIPEGGYIMDVTGPLGTPSEIEKFGTVICIGGGIGVAPIYPIAKKLKKVGNELINIIGYRSKNYVFWEEKMRSVSDKLLIATNDGTYGEKGFVTDILKKLLESNKKIDRIITIGPAVMMKAVSDMTRPQKIKTIASLNALMVCGMGMCGACRVTVGGETKLTCSDGPDFDAHLVDFDELMKRLNVYKNEEKYAFEKWKTEAKI